MLAFAKMINQKKKFNTYNLTNKAPVRTLLKVLKKIFEIFKKQGSVM